MGHICYGSSLLPPHQRVLLRLLENIHGGLPSLVWDPEREGNGDQQTPGHQTGQDDHRPIHHGVCRPPSPVRTHGRGGSPQLQKGP